MLNIIDDSPILRGEEDGVIYYLKKLKVVAHNHGWSESHLRLVIGQRDIITTKWDGKWYVEVNLSEHKRQALRQAPP